MIFYKWFQYDSAVQAMVLPMLSKNGEDYMSFILLNGDVFMSFTSKHTNVKETTSPAITLKNKKQMIQGVFDEVF